MNRPARPRWTRLLLVALTLPALVAGPGCTRAFYHKRVDRDVASLLDEKSADPRWSLDGYSVLPDPRSRFTDVGNPDRPPMPPDDPGRQGPLAQPPEAAPQGRRADVRTTKESQTTPLDEVRCHSDNGG